MFEFNNRFAAETLNNNFMQTKLKLVLNEGLKKGFVTHFFFLAVKTGPSIIQMRDRFLTKYLAGLTLFIFLYIYIVTKK